MPNHCIDLSQGLVLTLRFTFDPELDNLSLNIRIWI